MAKQAEAFSKGAGLRHHADVSAGPPDPGTDQALRIFPYFFKKNWANPDLFFIYFWSFETNNTIFTTNQCEEMLCQSSIRRRDSNPQPFYFMVVTNRSRCA